MRRRLLAYLPYGVASLAVLAPLLRPGYILTLDLVFAPHLPFPRHLTNDYLWHLGLWLLDQALPSELIEKSIFLAILLVSAIGMHRLVEALFGREQRTWSVYIAGLFYMVNPFTYSRFMTGQYAVLLGYALLPWFVRGMVSFARFPTRRRAVKLGLVATAVAIVSIHTLGSLAILCVAAVVPGLWRYRHSLKTVRPYVRHGAVAIGVFVLANSYWLVLVLAGRGDTASRLARMGPADVQAFATLGDDVIMRTLQVLRLQGFWAEGRDFYVLPQQALWWMLPAVALLALVVYGLVQLWRQRPGVARWLLLSMALSAVVAAGGVSGWAVSHLPLVGGFRDAHKVVGVLALGYSVALAYAVRSLSQKYLADVWRERLVCWGTLLMVVLFTWPMWWGFSGQLQASKYPADWYEANAWLNQDSSDFQVLFLPWYQYMSFEFTGRIVANPAPWFFDRPVLSSDDPEFGGLPPTSNDPSVRAVSRLLPSAEHTPDLARQFANQHIKYIVVARELDYEQYDYLRTTPGLMLVKSTPTLLLYRNQLQE